MTQDSTPVQVSRRARATSQPTGAAPTGRRRRRHGALVPYLFITPNIIGVGVFLLFPLAFSLYLSFFKWDLLSTPSFVGVDNYINLLTKDPLFWTAFENTAIFTVGTIVPTVVFALISALALNQRLRGITVFRAILFMPLVASTVAMSVIWRWIFNTDNGLLNWMLSSVGLGGPDWLQSTHTALLALIIVSVWKSIPFATVILLAAIQGVPNNLQEAASIDGANGVRRFFSITLPLIVPTLSFVIIISMIQSFQVFDLAYVITGSGAGTLGGPGTSTYVFGIMLFQNAFSFYKMGYASALAWILFVILLAMTYLQLRSSRKASEQVF